MSLTEAASADAPLRAEDVDFYDSSVLITHADGREFFPYERALPVDDADLEVE